MPRPPSPRACGCMYRRQQSLPRGADKHRSRAVHYGCIPKLGGPTAASLYFQAPVENNDYCDSPRTTVHNSYSKSTDRNHGAACIFLLRSVCLVRLATVCTHLFLEKQTQQQNQPAQTKTQSIKTRKISPFSDNKKREQKHIIDARAKSHHSNSKRKTNNLWDINARTNTGKLYFELQKCVMKPLLPLLLLLLLCFFASKPNLQSVCSMSPYGRPRACCTCCTHTICPACTKKSDRHACKRVCPHPRYIATLHDGTTRARKKKRSTYIHACMHALHARALPSMMYMPKYVMEQLRGQKK